MTKMKLLDYSERYSISNYSGTAGGPFPKGIKEFTAHYDSNGILGSVTGIVKDKERDYPFKETEKSKLVQISLILKGKKEKNFL